MFLIKWFYNTLASLGLHHKPTAKILFLGLDNAGKTTLLHMLKKNHFQPRYIQTLHPNTEELTIGQFQFQIIDLDRREVSRRLWPDYFEIANGIVYIVDAVDRGRFPHAKRELDELRSTEELGNIPFLVLGNKMDVSTAASEEELRDALGLVDTTYGKEDTTNHVRPIEIYMCSVATRMGYMDGLLWLSNFLS